MMRVAASAAVVGALIAGGALYSSAPALRAMVASWLEASAETAPATEAWPICTTMTAMGSEVDWAQLDPDFAAGKRALAAEEWKGAIAALELAALRDPRNADIQNYIGYAYWRLHQPGPAMGHFHQALMFSPRHRGAREHLGDLYLMLGEPVKAEEQLVALKDICLVPCNEVPELERAIATYYHSPMQRPRVAVENLIEGTRPSGLPE
jgi:Flp pilus assembly protein TadD